MNKKTKIIILISACLLIVVIGIYFLFPKGSNTQNIYVQKVSTIIGSSYTENRYSGVVESSETVDINSDGNKSITEMYVEAGQKVRKGDKLFSYDTTEASNSIAQKKLDIEAQNNEIAAQNAFYCIYKDYKETGNTYALPALFTLLLKKPRALEDELYRSNPDPKLVGFGGMTLSAPYIRSDRAMVNRLPIMKFLLQSFYDEESKKFTIDTTLPYHIPSEEEVVKFTNEYVQSQYANKNESVV